MCKCFRSFRYICSIITETMTEQDQILALREELHQHNYNYYVLNTPTISDKEFDDKMRLLQPISHAVVG